MVCEKCVASCLQAQHNPIHLDLSPTAFNVAYSQVSMYMFANLVIFGKLQFLSHLLLVLVSAGLLLLIKIVLSIMNA